MARRLNVAAAKLRPIRLGVGLHLDYSEAAGNPHFNTAILVDGSGALVGKYRKILLPDHDEHRT